jgi:tetrapyrrole methylase family protein/MazG family protein
MIHVVGLGPGDPLGLPPRAFALLTGGLPVYLRTARHPTVETGPLADALKGLASVTALDDEYETNSSFDDTYDAIVARVLRAEATEGEIVYAVPGHPLFGETTVSRLLAKAKEANVAITVTGASSFVDACLEAVAVALTDDLHVIDALTLDPSDPVPHPALRANGPLLLYQVHSRDAASNTKLALMNAGYPDEFAVTLVRAAGVPGQQHITEVPLFELDRAKHAHDHLTSVWVPMLPADQRRPGFEDLVRVMARLRNPDGGCPWDLKQTHATLRRYVIEEAYEVVDAIDALADDDEYGTATDHFCEELGDLLLQVVFHAQLAAEEGTFEIGDVCTAIVEKLIRRHPHVFGEVKVDGADEVLTNWEAIKAQEKGNAPEAKPVSVLEGIPSSLPALMKALEVSRRVVKVGFEWPDTGGVLDKVEEEFAELRAEIEAGGTTSKERIAAEMGDLLFTLVNVARHLGVDPEEALRSQIARFSRRFRHIESRAADAGRPIEDLSLEEMEVHWQEAKMQERSKGE